MLSGPGVVFSVSLIAERSSFNGKSLSIGVVWDIAFRNSRVWIGKVTLTNVADNLDNCWIKRTGLQACWICVIFGRNTLGVQRWDEITAAVTGEAFDYLPNLREISVGCEQCAKLLPGRRLCL